MRFLPHTLSLLMLLVAPALSAEPDPAVQPQPRTHPVPVDLIISDLREAYSELIAEEVTVRYRAPQAPQRSETFTIRIDPGLDPAQRPRQVLLELGPLRVHLADGQLTAVNRTAPERFARQAYEGPITPELIAELLPPLPLPQLALAIDRDDLFADPTPYTPDVMWASGLLLPDEVPAVMILNGHGPRGPISLAARASEARLIRIEARIDSPGGEALMELRMRPVAPGNPELWAIDVEGREQVSTLADLRPVLRSGPMPIGTRVPDLAFERTDGSRWSLYSAIRAAEALAPPGEAPAPVAMVLLRIPADLEEVEPRLQQARRVLRGFEREDALSVSSIAIAAVTPLAEFSRDHRDATRAMWLNMIPPREQRRELLWGYSPGQSIELFHPDAAAIVVLITDDRRLAHAVRLDELSERDIAEALQTVDHADEGENVEQER